MLKVIRQIDSGSLALLLSLSHDMASIRHKSELLQVIRQKLKSILPFNDTVIDVINEDGVTQSPFIFDVDENRLRHPDFEEAATGAYPFPDGTFERVLQSSVPLKFDVQLALKQSFVPDYIRFIDATGVKELIGMRLVENGRALGVFYLQLEERGAFTERHSNVMIVVASLLSTVVANLLNKDQIVQRGKENEILLNISHAINTSKKKEDLLHIIEDQLKQLFMFQEIVIALSNKDGQSHSAVIHTTHERTRARYDFQKTFDGKYPFNDGIYNVCLSGGKELILDMDELIARNNVPDYVRFWYAAGTREMIVLPLQSGEQKLGCLYLPLGQKGLIRSGHLQFIKNVSNYLSTAVSNILAQEQIEKQLIEINSYRQQLESENLYLQEEAGVRTKTSDIIGSSQPMEKILQLIERVARTDSTVLILGETGTGKELVARAIHNQSARKDKLMVKVNCAALPASLIESELFGHEKGSFTGAVERRIGKFELANNGTLFLDEIGEMPLELQVKLLRAIQEREIERVGGKAVIKINVRIISATNRNLEHEVHSGKFRGDLFYRLNVFPITIPPLRERPDDIPALAAHFTSRFARREGKTITNISNAAMKSLLAYPWPGNVRELEHIIERSVLLSNGRILSQVLLPLPAQKEKNQEKDFVIKTWHEFEREYILNVLKATQGKVSGPGGAAELLGIPATTLYSRMKKLGLSRTYS